MVIEKERGKVVGGSPRKIVAKNCKQSTIEKHRVEDTSGRFQEVNVLHFNSKAWA